MEKTICEKCKYEWLARVENPKKCPNCQKRFSSPVIKNEKQIKQDKIIKIQRDKIKKRINRGEKIEYDSMLGDLKKSANKRHKKSSLDHLF